MLLILGLAAILQHDVADDSLMARGVTRQLARFRAAHIDDVRYDLALDVTRSDSAMGTVRITFTRGKGGDVILDFRGYELANVVVNGNHLALPGGRDVDFNGAHLRVRADRLRDGRDTIEARFRSPIAAAGASVIRFTDDIDKRDYLYTLLVPADANLLFPCFDQPDLKAVFTLTLTVPNGWTVLSNGLESQLSGLRVTTNPRPLAANVFRFAPTKPIPTYLFAFAAGPFVQLQGLSPRSLADSTKVTAQGSKRAAPSDITLWVRASRAKEVDGDTIIALNARARAWMAEYFGVPYPFDKFEFLLAPAFPFGGMEHPGAIFYNEEAFIFREPPTLTQKLGRQATVNHEVAHQWFGDYTTMRWFDDLWLKEGFATYMAAKMQAASGDSTAWMTFYLRNKPAAYDVDVTTGTTPIWQELANLDQAKSNYGAIVYNKAPAVLKQLNYLVGDTAFREGVHNFLVAHAYGNGTWQDLLAAIGRAARRDLADWGRAYFLRPGIPIVEQHLDIDGDGRIQRLALIQHPAQALSGRGSWPMKTELRLQYGDRPPLLLPIEIKAETTVVASAVGLPAPDFVYANANDYAYGLFMLDDRSRDWLLEHQFAALDPFLRAMLWGSLWDLVRDARLDPARYVDAALSALPNERDEQIVSRLIGRVGHALDTYLASDPGSGREPADRAEALIRRGEDVFLSNASDAAKSYGLRKSYFDGYVTIARTPEALARLNAWLDSTSAASRPLLQPTRWNIVTALVAQNTPTAGQRLVVEAARDSTSGGQRRAFIAGAASPRADVKHAYFERYLSDRALNEDWVTASLGAFNTTEHAALSLPYLRPALDTLPWIQRNRRIFFLGNWLGAFISGQRSTHALAIVDDYLAENPNLSADLRRKVLQARDDLERTVRIRTRFAN